MRVTTTDGWNTVTDVSAPFSIGGQLSDGQIVFNDWGSGAVWTADIDGGGAKQIADRGRHPRWSPDGTRLAWDYTDLYTAKPDGSDIQKITTGKTYRGRCGPTRTRCSPSSRTPTRRATSSWRRPTAPRRTSGRRPRRSSPCCATSSPTGEGARPRRPLRGLVVDLELRRRQGRRAARGEVLRLVLARRALRGRHAGTAATPTRASTSSSSTSRPDAEQPHRRHLRRLQRLPDLVADGRVDRLGLQQGPQRRDRLRRHRPLAHPPRRHGREEDRRRQGLGSAGTGS